MDSQVENAIQIAFSPTSDPSLKSQAYEYINQLRYDPSGWQVCLSLFVREPAPQEVVRLVCLEVVNSAIQAARVDAQGLELARETLWTFVQRKYRPGAASPDPPHLQNKLTQCLTYLFCATYSSTWSSFFDDSRALTGDSGAIGTANPSGTVLYLRLLRTIHDEIGDNLVSRSGNDAKRNTELKDLIRARDVNKIAASWQEILSRWREVDLDIVELSLRCLGSWASWIDVSLVVNSGTVEPLWSIASQQDIVSESREGKARNAAIDTFTDVIAKKMPPSSKVELVTYLNIPEVLRQLVETPGLSTFRSTSKYDTDLGETVGKLTNVVFFDIVKILDTDSVDAATKNKADELLRQILPFVLRFFTDEYDEICWSVMDSLTDFLTMVRRKVKGGDNVPAHYAEALRTTLDSIITKMKYDETVDWGADDERTDEAEFQELRKKLQTLQQTIASIDEPLFSNAISTLIARTFGGIEAGQSGITWRELDLALYEMFLFGELAVKHGGLYQKGEPANAAGVHLIDMMTKMVAFNLAAHSHPAVQLQYLEICVRYCSFFEHNTDLIRPPLENFVRLIHSDHPKVRTRSWYLFFRFVKHLRVQLGTDAETIMQAFGDLLQIRAELPADSGDDDDSSDGIQSVDAVFDAQLYLFETIGCIASTNIIPVEKQTLYARTVLEPIMADISNQNAAALGGDERAILQVHHDIMAIGTLAKGFCEWMPSVSSAGSPPPPQISIEFETASERILSALESLKSSFHIRTAARFSFTRMLGVLGARILQQLPRWIEGLLTKAASKDELATFLRLLDQVVFGFKTEILSVLDTLLTPLLQRVLIGVAETANGTDDEMQLQELKSQYLSFILVILNNDLAGVLVSDTNQATFENLLGSFEHFCRDATDYNTARLSFAVLQKMLHVWGGPDLPLLANGTQLNGQAEPAPLLPGFDDFAMKRFSPLVWGLVANDQFRSSDAQGRTALNQAASLQWTILRKCGPKYEAYLRDQELKDIGLSGDPVDEYITCLRGDVKEWRKWFASFVSQGRGG